MGQEEQITVTFNRIQFDMIEEVMTEYDQTAAQRFSYENWRVIQEIRIILAAGRNALATGEPGAPPPPFISPQDQDMY